MARKQISVSIHVKLQALVESVVEASPWKLRASAQTHQDRVALLIYVLEQPRDTKKHDKCAYKYTRATLRSIDAKFTSCIETWQIHTHTYTHTHIQRLVFWLAWAWFLLSRSDLSDFLDSLTVQTRSASTLFDLFIQIGEWWFFMPHVRHNVPTYCRIRLHVFVSYSHEYCPRQKYYYFTLIFALEWRPHAGEDGDTSHIIRGLNRLRPIVVLHL